MSKLFEEINLDGVAVKNRYAVAPMGISPHDEDGGVGAVQKAYMVERAKGGFGLVYPGAQTVTDKYEHSDSNGNHLFTMSHATRLASMVQEIHRYGAKVAVQLTPGYGRVNCGVPGYNPLTGYTTIHASASETPSFYYPDNKCHALTVDEIHDLVECMGRSAALAKMAGVDIIEIHAYGGYMIDQFISKIWNHREDEYGGSLENRLRFFNECFQAIRSAVGPDYPLSVKFCPQHELPGGRTLDDEGIELAKIFDGMGFAYLHIDTGCYERWNRAIPAAYDKPGILIDVARRLRKEGIKSPIMLQGKMNDPAMAEKVLEEGIADMIALGKQSTADPYYPHKVQTGHFEDINYCMACGECLNGAEFIRDSGCAINPRTTHENEYVLHTPKTKRRLLVIGGGPGGMYTAKLAAQQGHDVELWEKSTSLGGNINAAGGPDFKFDIHRFNDNLQKQVYKAGVRVQLMKEATKEAIDAYAPDAVIIAAGARSVVPPIPGVQGSNVIDAVDLLSNKRPTGDKVLVLGGGEVGCEAALYLDEQGKQVTVVEMQDQILNAMLAMNSRMGLMDMINASHVKFYTGTKLEAIESDHAVVSNKDGKFDIDCDTVVLAVGFKPDKTLSTELKGSSYKVFTIGDYNKPRKVWDAVHEGFHIIRLLDELMDVEQ